MKLHSIFAVIVAAMFMTNVAFAEIDPGATSASHALEESATAIHGYLHHHYSEGYGSHGMESAAADMHDALHEYEHGELSESEVDDVADALRGAWNDFRQALIPAGLLNAGDAELNGMYQDVKDKYKALRFLLRKAK